MIIGSSNGGGGQGNNNNNNNNGNNNNGSIGSKMGVFKPTGKASGLIRMPNTMEHDYYSDANSDEDCSDVDVIGDDKDYLS